MLVEDCHADQVAICRYLEHNSDHAYEVLVANTGAEGLEICRTTPVDLVLLDHCLPDLKATAFLKALHNLSNQPASPVIVITGQDNETTAVQLLKAGVKDYLVKGQFNAQSLQSSVRNVLRQAQFTEKIQRSNQKERLITQIGQKIHRSLELDKVLEATVQEVRQFLQTDRVLVFKLEPNSAIGHVVAEAVEAPWQSLLANSFEDPCLIQAYAQTYRQGKVTAISDLDREPVTPCYQAFLNHLEVRATLVVPILREDILWGLLIAHHCQGPRLWNPTEIDLLKQLSTHVGVALHRVELYLQIQQQLAEQQQTAQCLLESQERLQLGVQVAGVGLAKFDYTTNTVELSPEAAHLYGLPADELVVPRDLVHATFHPDERNELDEIIRQVLDPTGTGWFAREHRVFMANWRNPVAQRPQTSFFSMAQGHRRNQPMQC